MNKEKKVQLLAFKILNKYFDKLQDLTDQLNDICMDICADIRKIKDKGKTKWTNTKEL